MTGGPVPRQPGRAYPLLDAMKLLMALAVVEIHTKPAGVPDGPAGDFLLAAEGVVVPFFFIASGFLCFRSVGVADLAPGGPGERRARGACLRLLRLYAVWSLVYLPVSFFGLWLQGASPLKGALLLARGFLVVGENWCSWPLWYLLASAVGFALAWLMLRGGVPLRRILAASAALCVLGWGMEALYASGVAPEPLAKLLSLYFKAFVNVRNGLFEGFFYVVLGMCMGVRREGLVSLPAAVPAAVFAAAFAGCALVTPDQHLPFCALASAGLLLLSTRRAAGEGLPALRRASTVI